MDILTHRASLEAAIPAVLDWYRKNRRSVPWRDEPSPYGTWLSEIMLQQTRITAVIPYYLRFRREIPDIPSLAAASDERLMKLWEGLGYYSRVRNLKKAAIDVCEKHGGRLPASYEELRRLPGIGDYTAGAIASIAFGLPRPAVDGNVLRVIMRYLGEYEDIAKASVKATVTDMLAEIYPTGRDAGDLTEGLMEIGEVACLPNGAPLCEECPLNARCRARLEGLTDELPVKTPKRPRATEERAVFILRYGNRIAIRKRPESGLLAGLWEFPSFTIDRDFSPEIVLKELGVDHRQIRETEGAIHIFTHVEWHMYGYTCECDRATDNLIWVTPEELREAYAVPSAYRVYRTLVLEEG